MRAIPGVEAVGHQHAAIHRALFWNDCRSRRSKAAAGPAVEDRVCVTDANYFQTMQIPLKQGRLYTEQEATQMRHVVLVNEAFVRKNLGGENPIGHKLTIYMKDDERAERDHRRRRRSQTSRARYGSASRFRTGRIRSWSIRA
jgi:hypothetical protein